MKKAPAKNDKPIRTWAALIPLVGSYESVEINKEEFSFGRAATCDRIINASEISNVHCSIYRVKKENGQDFEYFVEDKR
jgi:hypothetical protein